MIIKRLGIAAGLVLISVQLAGANFEKGQDAVAQKDFVAAVQEWRAVANYGHKNAQISLGKLYEKGAEGVDADIIEAYAWFKLAAAQGVAEAKTGLDRILPDMTAEQIDSGNSQAVAALGMWYRNFTGQEEAAFQQAKAEAATLKQQQLAAEQDGGKDRAEKQRALIAQRNAAAKEAERVREENLQSAILAAQQQAEEAKQQAFLLQQQIDSEKRLAATKVEQSKQSELDTARARLEELKAKQSGASVQAQTSIAQNSVPTSSRVISSTAPVALASPAKTAIAPTVAAVPGNSAVIQQAALVPLPAQKPGGTDVTMQAAELTEKKIVIASASPVQVEATKGASISGLENMTGLEETVVVEIFENAKTVALDTDAAQKEISDSLVRIDALKWSLISGAKGDKSAPKMNKILMSRMSPIQIAEANRLAGEWIIDRQKRL